MLVPPESLSAVLVMISSKSVSICNCCHARRANSGKIMISLGVPFFDALILPTQQHKICSQETRDPMLPYGRELESGLESVQGHDR